MQTDAAPTVGVVGLGDIGEFFAARARESNCTIVGADADEQARNRFARTFGVDTYDDFREMYRDDVDVAVIATPNRYHEGPATAAFDAGLDVFIEKPLAHNYESAARIAEHARQSEGICGVSYYDRFHPCVTAFDEYRDDGYFGDITHVEARYLYRRRVPSRGSWYTSRDIAGGGVLQDKGSFVLALLAHLGYDLQTISSVSARTRMEFGHRDDYTSLDSWGTRGEEDIFDVEDSISAFLEFDNRTTASLEIAWAMNGAPEYSYKIRGIDGGADINLRDGSLTLFGVDRNEGRLPTERIEPNFADHTLDDDGSLDHIRHQHELQTQIFERFLESRKGDVDESVPGASRALDVQRAIDNIYAATEVTMS